MEVLEQEAIAHQSTGRHYLFEQLYLEAFPKVARYISSRNGAFEDARDIFQDALVIYYEKSLQSDFVINTTPEAYLLGIAKHLWLRKFSKDKKTALFTTAYDTAIPEQENINSNRLLRLLETTGRKCMDLLRSFYYEEQPLKQTASALNYSNEHSAAVQKYKCLEKVRDTIKENSISYEAFVD